MGRPKVYHTEICSIEGCGRKRWQRGWCTVHYHRSRRHGGDPLGGKPYMKGIQGQWIEDNVSHEGDACLIWPFRVSENGYPNVLFRGDKTSAHRAMCIAAHGDPPAAHLQAAHGCGNGHLGCVNPKHLRWATPKENGEDKILHGTSIRSGQRKLTKAQVLEVIASDERVSVLARRYGVHVTSIHKIRTGKSYIDVTGLRKC